MGCVDITPTDEDIRELDDTIGSKALLDSLHNRDFENASQLLGRPDALRFVEFHESVLCEACQANAPMDIIRSIFDLSPKQLLYKKGLGFTPLHYACYADSSEEVRQFLLNEGPEAASIASATDHIPLHAAIRTRKNTAFIKKLLHVFPEGVLVKALNGQTPLDLFFLKWNDKLKRIHSNHGSFVDICCNHKDYKRIRFAKEVLLLLMKTYIKCKLNGYDSKKEWLPLHETVRHQNATSIFKQLIAELIPETRLKKDRNGNLALHLALTTSYENDSNEDFVQLICDKNPMCATTTDINGTYPIELAIVNGKKWDIIFTLHMAAPKIISLQSDKTGMNPFVLASCSPKACANVVYELLKLDPSVLKEVGP